MAGNEMAKRQAGGNARLYDRRQFGNVLMVGEHRHVDAHALRDLTFERFQDFQGGKPDMPTRLALRQQRQHGVDDGTTMNHGTCLRQHTINSSVQPGLGTGPPRCQRLAANAHLHDMADIEAPL